MKKIELDSPTYTPERFLHELIVRLNLRNDAGLSRALDVSPPVICKIRNRKLPIGASLILRAHEETGMSVKEIKSLITVQ